MTEPARNSPGGSDPGLGFGGFVALMAALMAMNALGIDSMLPALPAIGKSLGVATANHRQWIIFAYMIGFGLAQIVWGSLADHFGRKPIVVTSALLFSFFSLVIVTVPSFTVLLIARFLQGVAASASRVLVASIVRDCYSGRLMARVMSLAFIVFLCVPMFAPGIGSLVLALAGSWRMIFILLGVYGMILAAIAGLRLRETLHPEYRRSLSFAGTREAMGRVVTNRNAIGYCLAGGCGFGAMMGFVNSIEQIVADIFHDIRLFPFIFASIAASMGFAAFFNQRFVVRLGTRRISHSALLAYILGAAIHLAVAATGHETLPSFIALTGFSLFCQGLIGSNFNAMAMESVGDIAGTAASVQGFISTCLAATIGLAIGQSFNGSTVPIATGFSILGLVSLCLVLFAERGRLFRAHHPKPVG